MSWNPLSRRSPIGIDVTPRHLHAAQLSGGAGRWRLEAALTLPRPEGSVDLTDHEVSQLADVLPRRGFHGTRAVLCMPDEHVITEVFHGAELKGGMPDATALRDLVAKAHRCEPNAVECASWPLPAARAGGPPSGVMAVACRHDLAEHYLDVIEGHDIQVDGLDVRCQALARACAGTVKDPDSLAALVDLGWTSARLIVLCGSTVIFERTLGDCGLNRLEMALTGRLGLEPDIADYVLTKIGLGNEHAETPVASSLLDEIHVHVETYVQRFITELKRSFSYAVQEYPDRCFTMVALAGEGAVMPGLATPIGEALGVRAEVVAPADAVQCPTSLMTLARSPLLTVATGLAMYERGGTA